MTRLVCCICWPSDKKFPKFVCPINLLHSEISFGRNFPAVHTIVRFISICVKSFGCPLRTQWWSLVKSIQFFIQFCQLKKYIVQEAWLATATQWKILTIHPRIQNLSLLLCTHGTAWGHMLVPSGMNRSASKISDELIQGHKYGKNLESTENNTSKFFTWKTNTIIRQLLEQLTASTSTLDSLRDIMLEPPSERCQAPGNN